MLVGEFLASVKKVGGMRSKEDGRWSCRVVMGGTGWCC